MAQTRFTGPVKSDNGFISGTATSPVSVSTAGNINSSYATTSAATGDTRLVYDKLTFTSTGSGETLRAYSVVTGAGAAAGGTINGAHISMKVDTGGTISGAANALRATVGASVASPGGTLAALQLDTDFASGTTVSAATAFIRVSDSGAGTGKIANLFNIETNPAATLVTSASGTVPTGLKKIQIRVGGTTYYVLAATAWAAA
jgi:hypothetical protein